jgi:hypothetical protein
METKKIETRFCVHCESLTIGVQSDTCACGAELEPVAYLLPPHSRIRVGPLPEDRAYWVNSKERLCFYRPDKKITVL